MAYDNVIIFGAGASFDAGIPLLNDFVDVMWNYAIRGKSRHGELSTDDKNLLNQANQIRYDLEKYNTRANFNTRNLEDVLSLLSFEAMAGGEALGRYQTWVNAVTRTIELSTLHPKNDNSVLRRQNSYYHSFWHSILASDLHQNPPAIITFNYDLVLERTLHDCFYHLNIDSSKPTKPTCKITYFLRPYDFVITSQPCQYDIPDHSSSFSRIIRHEGIKPLIKYNCGADVEIPYLKLHGSLNWCSRAAALEEKPDDLIPSGIFTHVVDTPLILPPVFNKMNSGAVNVVWKKALEILREAKHIIIVGYSLPKTDIYMQYFLKAAVGPNSSLQWVIVFDPALYRDDSSAKEMRSRYKDCFSPQFSERIVFKPDVARHVLETDRGKFLHFVEALQKPAEFLFTC